MNGPDFLPFKPDDLQSLTDPPRGGGLATFKRNFGMIRCHVDSFFHILHLQNAGNAGSSAEKCSIHRTKFDENDLISSFYVDRQAWRAKNRSYKKIF